MKKKYTKIFVVVILCVMSVIGLCSCEKNTEITEIIIGERTVAIGTQELVLQPGETLDASQILQFTNLKKLNLVNVDAEYDAVKSLQMQMPECEMIYNIIIDDTKYQNDINTIDFSDKKIENADELLEKLGLFNQLANVNFSSDSISVDNYYALVDAYTEIDFNMDIHFHLANVSFSAEDTVLDLSSAEDLDMGTLMQKLAYFENIEQVDFGGKELSPERMTMLMDTYPDTAFNWNTYLLNEVVASDVEEIDLSEIVIEDYDKFLGDVKYLSNVEYIDMCDCGLSNEEMENLVNTYPHIKFVWKIRVGNWTLRTDVKAFSTGNTTEFEGGYFNGGLTRLYNPDVVPLKYCTDLIALDVGHMTYFTDFSFLNYMPKLQYLIVAITNITDLSPLANMPDLMYLEMFRTDVEDLSPLLELKNLKHLNLSITDFDDMDIFVQMTQLERLWIQKYPSKKETLDKIQEISDALPNTTVVYNDLAPTSGGWRSRDAQVYIDMQALFNLRPMFFE